MFTLMLAKFPSWGCSLISTDKEAEVKCRSSVGPLRSDNDIALLCLLNHSKSLRWWMNRSFCILVWLRLHIARAHTQTRAPADTTATDMTGILYILVCIRCVNLQNKKREKQDTSLFSGCRVNPKMFTDFMPTILADVCHCEQESLELWTDGWVSF